MRSLIHPRWRTLPAGVALTVAGLLVPANPAGAQASWTVVPSPSPGATANNLADVTAAVPGAVWAVGSTYDNATGAERTLALRFNGTAWTRVTTPNTAGGTVNRLDRVDASAADNVWAIGSGAPLRFDGTAWRTMPATTGIRGLDVVAPGDVWGVGTADAATRVARWNGSAWTVIPSLPPAPTRHLMAFEAVAARTPTDVWAVGWDRDYTPRDRPVSSLIAHWDGVAWTRVPSPSPRTRNTLNDVVVVAPDDIWAVGVAQDVGGGIVNHSLALHWNGTAWTDVTVPAAEAGAPDQLLSVTAVSASSVWAVGYYASPTDGIEPLIEHWDGTRWSVNPTPATGTPASLGGVAAAGGSGTVWAVGGTQPPSPARTLTMLTRQG
jgi:hypothetical protein